MAPTADKLHDTAVWREVAPDPPPGAAHRLLSSYFDRPLGYRALRPRGAGNWLLMVTIGGEGRFRQPECDLRLRAGDVLLVEPTAYSDYGTARRRWQFHWVHFLPPAGWAPWLGLEREGRGLHRAHLPPGSARERTVNAFRRLHADLIRRGPLADDLALAALAEILLVINRETGAARPLDARIARALDLIQTDLTAPHSVTSLARTVALSPSRFAHLFREQAGSSVVQMVNKLRVRQAMRLLASTAEPIGTIGEAVGFSSPHYFSRHFRQLTGQSPRAYRETAAGGRQGVSRGRQQRTAAM